jgi:hypothetical protein
MAGTFFAPRYWVSDYWLTDYFGGEEQPAGSIAANLSSAVSVAAQLGGIGAASADLVASFTASGTLNGAEPTGDMFADLAFNIGLSAENSYTGEAVQPPVLGGGGIYRPVRLAKPRKQTIAAGRDVKQAADASTEELRSLGAVSARLVDAYTAAAKLSGGGGANTALAASDVGKVVSAGAAESAVCHGAMNADLALGVDLTGAIGHAESAIKSRPGDVGVGEWIGRRRKPSRKVKPAKAVAALCATIATANLRAAISGAANGQAEMSGAVTLTGTLTIDMTQTQMDNEFWLMAA